MGVFLTEHPQFLLGVSRGRKRRCLAPWEIPTTREADSMTCKFNEPNYSYIIGTFTPAGEFLMYWRIDQKLGNPRREADEMRNANQVDEYLSGLTLRTGLGYAVYLQAPKDDVDWAVEKWNLEVS